MMSGTNSAPGTSGGVAHSAGDGPRQYRSVSSGGGTGQITRSITAPTPTNTCTSSSSIAGSATSRFSSKVQGHYQQGQRGFGSNASLAYGRLQGPGGSSRSLSGTSHNALSQGVRQQLQKKGHGGSTHSLTLSLSRARAGLLHRSNPSLNSQCIRLGHTHSLSGSRGWGGSEPSLTSRGSFGRVAEFVDIDMAISNFHIEFEIPGARYKPGDELRGKVIMDVWASIDIKHVEFHIAGKGTLRMFQNASTFIERPKYEVYLDKNIVLIGSTMGKRGVTLDPGRYITNFQYKLPDEVPPSVHQFDMGNGYVFDISYLVQARVCDFAYTHGSAGSKLRVVKATRKSFTVMPLEDWHTIPGAMEPTVHSDQLLLFCGVGRKDTTTVLVTMDRAIYPVGDNIRLTTEVISPGKDAIKDITAELEQQLFFDSDLIKKFRRVILKACDNGRNQRITRTGATVKSSFGISLPKNIIPSYLPNCKMIDLQYTMKVKVRFKKFGGKLVIRIPVVIAPACDGDRKDGKPPLFNKPVMQFPYFSKSALNGGAQINNGYQQSSNASDESIQGTLNRMSIPHGRFSNQDNVTTKYKTAFNCCGCCLLCLGFGIIES